MFKRFQWKRIFCPLCALRYTAFCSGEKIAFRFKMNEQIEEIKKTGKICICFSISIKRKDAQKKYMMYEEKEIYTHTRTDWNAPRNDEDDEGKITQNEKKKWR